MTDRTQHRADGGDTLLAAQLSAHRLHAALVLFAVEPAFESVISMLDGEPPQDDCQSASDWLDELQLRLPHGMGTAGLLRILATAESCHEMAPS